MNTKSYIEQLMDTGVDYKAKLALFRELNKDMDKVSEDTLMHILKLSENTEYGKKYGFADIKSVDDYRKSVPVTVFEDYAEYVNKMKEGKEDILFPGKAVYFANTSGTTGHDKLFPYNNIGLEVLQEIQLIRMGEMIKSAMIDMPDIRDGSSFAITNPRVTGATESGIPYGAISGKTGEIVHEKVGHKRKWTDALSHAGSLSMDSRNYVMILFNVSEKNVRTINCNNISHFAILWKLFLEKAETIIDDIGNGTISVDLGDDKESLLAVAPKDPERAKELREVLMTKRTFELNDVWPGARLVRCWYGGSVGRAVRENRKIFPENAIFWEIGYGASEGKLNIPLRRNDSYGVPTNFGYFLEYEPVDKSEDIGRPLLISETKDGHLYEVILTNYTGLYRYNIKDIVKIATNDLGQKEMLFCGKEKDKIVIGGNKLYAMTFMDYVEEYEKEHECFFKVFKGHEENGGLLIEIECHDEGYSDESFRKFIEEKLRAHGISVSGIVNHEDGYRDSLFKRSADSGKTVNQTKLTVFI